MSLKPVARESVGKPPNQSVASLFRQHTRSGYGGMAAIATPAPVARVAGRSRWQLLMHGPQASALPLPSGSSLWDGLPSGVSLAVDPDPLQL